MCKTQFFTCKICEKIGQFTSLCKTPMPERKNPATFRHENGSNPQQQIHSQTRRARHIEEQQQKEDEEQEEETVDAKAALYIKELMKD